MVRARLSRSVGYLRNAWCSLDSQILARNSVFVVTVACKSIKKHTKRTLPRRGEGFVPSENSTEEAHADSLCRLWDSERPRPQNPIPRHRKVFVVICCCVYKEPGRGARARHAARWLLGALEEQAERAHTRCAVHANAENAHFTAKDSAMASRPTQRNTKRIYARPGTEPNGPAIAPPRGPRPRGCFLLPRRSPSLRARSAPSLRA